MLNRRFLLVWVAPSLGLLLLATAALIAGERTLFLRDVLNVHFEMKWAQAEAMRGGYLPLIDPARFGGQALLGNPNAAALYPDSLLLLAASPLWVLNAHFWLHLLLAPFCFYWLGRAWGLGRRASWAAGICYAGSGFFLSNLNLYNLVAAVTWAPALAAAAMELAAGRRPARRMAAVALVWALTVLGGDPMTAALALALALSAVVVKLGLRGARWGRVGLGLTLGTALALPQIVEFLRILPQSFRGHWRFSEAAATAASFHPWTALEWLLPTAFGRPDLSFWGQAFYSGEVPLYFSLAPGALALVLVAASGKPRSAVAAWAWGAVALGVFVSLGRYNPLAAVPLRLLGGGLLRLPIKFWPWVAVGGALLCGVGFDRLLRDRGRRAANAALGALALVYGGLWLALQGSDSVGGRWLRRLAPERMSDTLMAQERLRWAGICLISLVGLAVLAVLLRWSRRRPAAAGAALAVHLALQLLLLRPLLPTDQAAVYRTAPPVTELIPPGATVVQGDAGRLFGAPSTRRKDYPDSRVLWLQRDTWFSFYPYAAVRWGRRAEFAGSPEGLDTFVARATAQAMERLPDARRVRLLEAAGVEYLVLGRPLAEDALGNLDALGSLAAGSGEIHLYRLRRTLPPVSFVGSVAWAEHLNAALDLLTEPAFDPRRTVVLAGEGPPIEGGSGRVEVLEQTPERLLARVTAASPGALVTRRAFLPIYRVRVDGKPASPRVANLHRLAVTLPAGEHRVEIAVDRRPLYVSTAVAVVAALFLAVACRRLSRSAPTGIPDQPPVCRHSARG